MIKHGKSVLAVILVLVLLSLACGTSDTPKKVGEVSQPTAPEESKNEPVTEQSKVEENQPTPDKPSNEITNFKLGDVVNIGDINLVVLGWSVPEGNEYSKPDEGKKFVLVEMVIVNNATTAESISTLMQMSLRDETSQKYDLDFTAATIGKGGLDGELAPGEKVRGDVGFQVQDDAKGLVFVFDASLFGSGKIFVELGSEPVMIDPPAEIAGETTQETYKVGDIIEIGDFSLVVNSVSFPQGTDFIKPDEGNKFIVVDLTVQNKTNEAVNISSLLQMGVKDSTGQSYTVDVMASTASEGTTVDGELVAGEKLRGQVGYQVPINATGLVFVFDASVFGSGKVFVAIE